MDQININDLILTPLRKIKNPKGEVLHGLKNSEKSFSGFGEAYFSKIDYNKIKGWTIHKEMTLNLIVPLGQVMFIIYDDRIKSNSRGNFNKIVLSNSNYQRLTVPPKLWVAFKGISKSSNLILNIANLKHNPLEMEKLPLNKIKYNWNST